MASVLKVDQLQGVSNTNNVIVPGGIIQVVEQKFSGRSVINGSYGYANGTGLKCSITPKSSNPTYLVISQIQYTSAGFNAGYFLYDNTNAQYVLYNDQSTDAWGSTGGRKYLSSGGIGSGGFNNNGSGADDYGNSSRTASGLYTPPNNNTLEIEVYMSALNNTGNIFIGGNESNLNFAYDSYSHCSLVIMEIAG